MKEKQQSVNGKCKRYGKRLLAIVLSMLMVICGISVGQVSVYAASITFDGSTAVYIDVGGCSWALDDYCVPVMKFYTGSSMSYTDCTKVSGSVYKVVPNAGTYAEMSIARHNTAGYYNEKHNISLESGKNEYIVNSGYNGGSWSSYTEVPTQKEYNATLGTSITDNENLYTVKASFFDYYTDTEINSGWRSASYNNSHGDWEPYHKLNTAIANLSSTTGFKFPLYFGNFWSKADGWTGSNSTNYYNRDTVQGGYLKNFSNWANNSAGIPASTDYANSVTGLTDVNLSDNMLKMASNSGSSLGFYAPYFDTDWITGSNSLNTQLGTVVNTEFPMRVTTNSYGDPYYEFWNYDFATKTPKDNIYFTGYDSGNLVLNYGSGSNYAVYDAQDFYGGGAGSQHPGFFPFDISSTNGGRSDGRATDFAFGMRLDIDFNLAKGGISSSGNPIEFNFEGDDDVWVYIDGKLVLDLGGDHKNAKGTIDFKDLTASVTTGVRALEGQTDGITRNTNFTWFNNNDNVTTHTLTLYYMERGMVESNLKFGFSMSPVGNQFIANKTVNVADVNAGLQEDVKNLDDFTMTHTTAEAQAGSYSAASNKNYTFSDGTNSSQKTTNSSGQYDLGDGDTAYFTDQFNTGDWFKVVEAASENSYLTYTPSWTATDILTEQTIATGDTTDSSFQFKTTSASPLDSTKIRLDYVNTPQVAPLSVTKALKDSDGTTSLDGSDNTKFNATFEVSLDGGTNYKTYPLQYKISGDDTVYNLDNNGKLNSNAMLQGGKTITFNNLPVNALVRITEDSLSGYQYVTTAGTDTTANGGRVTIPASGSSVTITNKKNPPDATNVVLKANKTLNGGTSDVITAAGTIKFTDFQFDLYEVDSLTATADSGTKSGATKNNLANGSVTFDSINFAATGTKYYVIKEVIGTDALVNYDSSIFRAKVVVTNVNGKLTPTVTYYKADGTTILDANKVVFDNTVKKGNVKIHKMNDNGIDLAGAKFKLEYADDNWNVVTGGKTYTGTTDAKGECSFLDLEIGNYLLTEVESPAGNALLAEPIKVTIPLVYSKGDIVNGVAMDTSGTAFDFTYEITNAKLLDMPPAGGGGYTLFYYLGGAMVLLAGTAMIIWKKKRHKTTKA